ncbi:MAG TPA: iron-containing alcohol dehydrogenase, partial [Acidimicrobiia bacterium]|nr:iron-containing alcohol dehydrogenase [Acidimicrobiia bacterium]
MTLPVNLPFELLDSRFALDLLPDTVDRHAKPGPIVVLTDSTAKFLAGPEGVSGDDLRDRVLALLPLAHLIAAGGHQVLLNKETIATTVAATAGAGCLVTLGSGTVTDLGKLVSHQTGVPLIAVQTAASVNGF